MLKLHSLKQEYTLNNPPRTFYNQSSQHVKKYKKLLLSDGDSNFKFIKLLKFCYSLQFETALTI